MDSGDDGQRGGHDREGHDVADGVDAAAPLALRDPSDEHVVDRDLPEHDQHEGDGDEEGGDAVELVHDREEQGLEPRHEGEHRSHGVVVDEVADHELSQGRDREDHERPGADRGGGAGDVGEAFVEDLREREGGALEDQAADRGGEHDDREHPHEGRALDRQCRRPGLLRSRALCADGGPVFAPRPHEHRVGDPEADGDHAGEHERIAPAAGVDEPPGEQRGGGNAEVTEHAVDRERDAGLRSPVHDHREADGVVDRGEHADREQSGRNLDRGVRHRRRDRARPDADEEDDHHALAAPLVREPPRRYRADAECDEPRRGVRNERGVAHAPFLGEPQRRDRREDQHEEVVEEVPDVEEQEVQAFA